MQSSDLMCPRSCSLDAHGEKRPLCSGARDGSAERNSSVASVKTLLLVVTKLLKYIGVRDSLCFFKSNVIPHHRAGALLKSTLGLRISKKTRKNNQTTVARQ